jgi:hypothetical protein
MNPEQAAVPERHISRVDAMKALMKSADPYQDDAYLRWRDQIEGNAKTPEAVIFGMMEDATLRKEAGLNDGAREVFEEARMFAYRIYREDLADEINEQLRDL